MKQFLEMIRKQYFNNVGIHMELIFVDHVS